MSLETGLDTHTHAHFSSHLLLLGHAGGHCCWMFVAAVNKSIDPKGLDTPTDMKEATMLS